MLEAQMLCQPAGAGASFVEGGAAEDGAGERVGVLGEGGVEGGEVGGVLVLDVAEKFALFLVAARAGGVWAGEGGGLLGRFGGCHGWGLGVVLGVRGVEVVWLY